MSDLHNLTEQLQAAGIAAFAQSYGQLLDALALKRRLLAEGPSLRHG